MIISTDETLFIISINGLVHTMQQPLIKVESSHRDTSTIKATQMVLDIGLLSLSLERFERKKMVFFCVYG